MSERLIPSNPDLYDLLQLERRATLLATNCHALGTVQSFNPSTQLAVVSVNYKRKISGLLVEYAPLADCPVVILGGGTASLEFPISQGDTGLLCFNDRDLDEWLVTGQTGKEPSTGRLHSFSDAVFICGLRPMTKSFSDYSGTHARFRLGTTVLELSSTVKIANQATDLKTVLNGIIDQVSTLVSSITPGSGMPIPAAAAVSASLAAYKTTIAGLLT